jgi:oligopeptidase B
MRPPLAKRVPHVHQRPSGPVDDPYTWLRDRDDPDTLAYLKAENAYTDEWFAPLAELRETIFQEIKGRTLETDLSVPIPRDSWAYYSRTVEGLDYPIHCRRPRTVPAGAAAGDEGAEQVLVDENAEAADSEFFALGIYDVSPDHSRLLWACDRNGHEDYELRVRDLATGDDLAERIVDIAAGATWIDDDTFFYLRQDEAKRPFQVWRHVVGTDPATDVLVHEDLDERFWVDVDRTRSGQWVVLSSSSKTSGEAWVLPVSDPLGSPRLVVPRRDDHEYSVDHWVADVAGGDRFVIVTNDSAEDFKVVVAPVDDPAAWTDLVPHLAGRRIMSVDPFATHLVLHEWQDATPQLRILFADGTERTLGFATAAHDVEPGANLEYGSTRYRFSYQALSVPAQVLEEDVTTGERELLKQTPVLGGFDPAHYRTARLWAPSEGGVQVPIDVVHHVDTPIDGTAACVLYAYGSYEASMAPWFSIARLSFLDRGGVFALAHPRGGGELGRRWYLDGKLAAKANTFTDAIACAEQLVAAGFSAADRLAVRGGSAGGLLVGVVVNRRPELFAAAVAEVPFVDVVTTMSDPSLPLTVTEWEEWGDPRTPEFDRVMTAYSPYDNVHAAAYPAMLVTAGLNDPRVSYHEPAKWVAKLRVTATGDAPLVLWTELGAGHMGPSGRYDTWREEARNLAFLIHVLHMG